MFKSTNYFVPLLIILLTLLALRTIIFLGQLVYGDIPYFEKGVSNINAFYVWSDSQLGTNVRQGFNTFRDFLLNAISINSYMYFFLKYILPIILVPITYYIWLKKLGVKNSAVLIVCSIAVIASPVFLGDFLTGQTVWIYLTIPWVFYFLIKLLLLNKYDIRNSVGLAVALFLCLGMLPPIIVPLVVVAAIFSLICITLNFSDILTNIKKFLISFSVSGLLFILLASPYVLAGASGQQAYTPPSLLSDYSNNYSQTDFTNIFRLAGNAGNGQKTLGYNDISPTNVFGFVLVSMALLGSVYYARNKEKAAKTAILASLISVMSVLGLLSLLNGSPEIGSSIFSNSWLVSTIRNPTKLYVILIPLFILLLAVATSYLYKKQPDVIRKRLLIGVLAVSVVVYGWPILRGDFGLLYGEDKIAKNYKPDPDVREVARDASRSSGRSILLPASHREELNYELISPSLNTFKLEGGLKPSVSFLEMLKNNLDNENPYFFNQLKAGGISSIYINKSQLDRERGRFSLFTPKNDYESINKFFIANNMQAVKLNENITKYTIRSSNLVYTPSTVVRVNMNDDIKSLSAFMGDGTATTNSNIRASNQTNYDYIDASTSKIPSEGGIAQLFDPRLIRLSLQKKGNELLVYLLQPASSDKKLIGSYVVGASDDYITIGDNSFNITDGDSKIVSVRSGDYNLRSGKLSKKIVDDSSFEKNIPRAGKARNNEEGVPKFYTESSSDSTDGKRSFKMGTFSNTAFISKTLPVDRVDEDYNLSFDYKNLKGNDVTYEIYQGNKIIARSNPLIEDNSKQWQNLSSDFKVDKKSRQPVKVYFYLSPRASDEPSEILIDNIALSEIDTSLIGKLDIPVYKPDIPISSVEKNFLDSKSSGNLLENGNFDRDSKEWNFGDATKNAQGDAEISRSIVNDNSEQGKSLQLDATKHDAFLSQNVGRFQNNSVYQVSFKYRNLKGDGLKFAIWQSGLNKSLPAEQLTTNSEWQNYTTTFIPDANTNKMAIYFYTSSKYGASSNLIDDVEIKRVPIISNYLVEESKESNPSSMSVKDYDKLSPTLVNIKLDNALPGNTFIFNESYSKSWKAYISSSEPNILERTFQFNLGKEIDAKDHFQVNGFANGWILSKKLNEGESIYVAYAPQRQFLIGMIVMFATIVVISGLMIYSRLRRKSESRN